MTNLSDPISPLSYPRDYCTPDFGRRLGQVGRSREGLPWTSA